MKFEEPKLKVIKINTDDIIQTSGETTGGGENETPLLPNPTSLDKTY